MSYLQAYEYEGSKGIPFKADEGAFTTSDDAIFGGSWATPLKPGMWVSLVAAKAMCVKKCEAGEIPIGRVVGRPQGGGRTRYSRDVAVDLIGYRVVPCEIAKTSADITVGCSVSFSAKDGVYGMGTWTIDTTANGTYALVPITVDSTNGGQVVPVLFGGPLY